MNVHVEYRRANQVYEDVLSNVVDMGLVAYPTRDAKLEIVPLRKDPLVLICHPQHPFAKQKSIKLKTLAGQKFIGFEPDIPTRKALDKILKEHGVDPKLAMEFDNIETVKRAVEIEAGISIVPYGTVVQEVAQANTRRRADRGRRFLPADCRALQKEQSAVAGNETIPDAAQGTSISGSNFRGGGLPAGRPPFFICETLTRSEVQFWMKSRLRSVKGVFPGRAGVNGGRGSPLFSSVPMA